MKRRNRFVKIIAILFAVMLVCLLCAATPIENFEYKVIMPYTIIYEEPDINSKKIFENLPQNAVVEVLDDNIIAGGQQWTKIAYTEYEGYVLYYSLYLSLANDNYKVQPVTIISSKMGQGVKLYNTHNDEAEAVLTIPDGEKVNLVSTGIDYGNFSYIEYEGKYYFVHTSNITKGLGYNQLLAVVIASCFLGAVIIAIIVIVLIRKKKSIN